VHDIPVGTYSAVFTLSDRSIEHEFDITNDQQTLLFVNMIENRVDVLEPTPVKEQTGPVSSAPFVLDWEGDVNRAPLVQPLPNFTSHTDAVISVRFEVRPDGTVGRLQPIIKGDPELESEVLRTLRSWRFSRLPANMPQKSQYGTATFRFVQD